MNTYRFKWLNSKKKNSEQLLLCVSFEKVQNAAQLTLGRRLSKKELGYFEILLAGKLETIVEGNGSLFSRVLNEAVLFSALEEVEFGNSPADLIV